MAGSKEGPPITPDMKVGELIEAYPHLEDVLIETVPAFKKLRNPVLRRTIAKITSLRHAAQVGGVSLGEIIGRLRSAAGQEVQWVEDGEAGAVQQGDEGGRAAASAAEGAGPGGAGEGAATHGQATRPRWVETHELVETFDAVATVEAGGHPLPEVMAALRRLGPGQAYAIVTPFVPAPMVDKAREAGFLAWTERLGPERFKTYFAPRPGSGA